MSIDTIEAHKYYMSNNISLNEAGKKFGMTGSSLRKRFVKNNLPTKSRNETRKRCISEFVLKDMYIRRNLSIVEMAKILGVSHGTIHNRISEIGLNKSSQKSKSDRYENYDIWTDEEDNIGKELLLETMDYYIVSERLNRSIGSIENRNRIWGIDLSCNSNLFGIPTIANDGNKYRSRFESIVVNFLLENKISFNYEVRVCLDRQWTCDFLICGLWVEVDGLGKYRKNAGSTNYSDDHEKIKYYKANGYNHLILKKSTWKKQLKEALKLC